MNCGTESATIITDSCRLILKLNVTTFLVFQEVNCHAETLQICLLLFIHNYTQADVDIFRLNIIIFVCFWQKRTLLNIINILAK